MGIQANIKKTIIEFIADLKDNVIEGEIYKTELQIVLIYLNSLSESELCNYAISNILPFKAMIQSRDLKFFFDNRHNIFMGLPSDRVEYFAEKIYSPETKGGISDEDRTVIWSYFDVMLVLCEKLKKDV